ncbi:MAG: hypothetical protein U0638_16500 [Phycisphaerales bacterium]
MPNDVWRQVIDPVLASFQFILLAMIVYEVACLALEGVIPIRSLLGRLWRRSHSEKSRPRHASHERPRPPAASIESPPRSARPQTGQSAHAAHWFDLQHTLKEPPRDSRPRHEFWLVWLARGGIGLAVLFILAVILGLLRMAWNLGRSILVKRRLRRAGASAQAPAAL